MKSNVSSLFVLFLCFSGVITILAQEPIYLSSSGGTPAPNCGSKETPCGSLQDAVCVATCFNVKPAPINKSVIYVADGVYSGPKNYGVSMSGTCGECTRGPYFSIADDFRIIGGTPENINFEPKANISCEYNIGGFKSYYNLGISHITLSGLIFDKCRPFRADYAVLTVYAEDAVLNINNCLFTKSLGSPVFFWSGGVLNVTGTVFSYNTGMGSYVDQSGLSIQSGNEHGMEVYVDNCTFIGNTNFNTKDATPNCGAGIYFSANNAYGRLTITNSHFERNMADQGSVLCLSNVTVTAEHTSFIKNSAMNDGGVMFFRSGTNARFCNDVSFSENVARRGDLVSMYGAKLVCNTTVFTADKIDATDDATVEDCVTGPTKKPVPPLTPVTMHRRVVSWQITTFVLVVLIILLGGCSMVCYYRKKARYAKITNMYKL
mmetsp:Transcript_20983/g.23382  ORF Transcript_20983/g.23382 Transcript_20983/m.23382 type:complete len:433 (+) Transcript_20983:1-1299(+)